MIKRILVGLFGAFLLAGCALAQSSPGLSYGQVPTAGQWNSYFAAKTDYPLAGPTITSALGYTPLNAALAPSFPHVSPASGNVQCAYGHYLPYVDQDWCLQSDAISWMSRDPSALLLFTLGGTVTTGDTVTLTFTFGAGACVSGCTAAYTAVGGNTLTSIAQGLALAIRANANLYNTGVGGYAGNKMIGYVEPPTGAQVALDFNSAIPLKVVPTISGSHTETVTIEGQTGCGTTCTAAWDNNPALGTGRLVTGMAPPAESQLLTIYSNANNSGNLTSITQQYGVIANRVNNSTVGAISGRWIIATPDVNGAINQGVQIGGGIYGMGNSDYGPDSANFTRYIGNSIQLNYSTPGQGVMFKPPAGGDYWAFTPPTTAGAPGAFLTSQGGGFGISTPMTWTSNVPNANLATMPTLTLKGNATGGTATPTDLTVAAVQAMLHPAYLNACVTGINANSANTDTALNLSLPSGITRYRPLVFEFFTPSTSLTTANVAVWTGAAGTGFNVMTSTALSPLTTNTPDTAGSNMNVGPTAAANTTMFTDTSLFVRIGTAQGSTATVDACLVVQLLG